MACTVFLVRHAPHDHVGRRLSGRLPGLRLTRKGAAMARRLARRFDREAPFVIQSSPIERAVQTAQALGVAFAANVRLVEALTEVDFGEWTGKTFDGLSTDARWHVWNARRAEGRCPGGERMTAVQRRVVDHLYAAAQESPRPIVMVTHCDVIRAAVADILGLSLDHIHRFEVSPASVTEIVVDAHRATLIQLNERVH